MLSTQYINLDMTPSGVLPVLYCSQYDIGRPLGMVVYNGGEAVDLSTYTCTIEATRTDGTAITATVTTDGNIGAFVTTATMTNVADKYPAKLVIVDGDGNRVASLAFVMCVTPATMDENAESIEEDRTLYQQYTGTAQTLISEVKTELTVEAGRAKAAEATLQANINSEATARANAVSAEATARQAADASLQSGIAAETSARQAADATLQMQIDQIIAPSGEAPSAAEVQNARIGVSGVTYQTLGDAIRTQVGDVQDMAAFVEIVTESPGYISNIGSISSAGNDKEVYTNYFAVVPGEVITFAVTSPNDRNSVWIAVGERDAYSEWVRRDVLIASVTSAYGYYTFTVPDDICYIAYSYRTFNGEVTVTALRHAANILPLATSIVQPYSSAKTYAAGDYTIYDGQLYICTANITSAESFNTSHWKTVTAMGELYKLRKDVNGYIYADNLISVTAKNKVHNGITFTTSSDTVVANGTASGAAFIDICTFTPSRTGTYLLTGCPSGGGGSKHLLYIVGTNTYDEGEGAAYDLTAGTSYTLRIIVYSGQTVNALTFTPSLVYMDAIGGIGHSQSVGTIELTNGSYQPSGVSADRARAHTQLFSASGTFTVSLANYTTYRFSVIQYPLDGVPACAYIDSGWKYSNYTFTVDNSHKFGLNISRRDDARLTDADIAALGLNITSNGFRWHAATVEDAEAEAKVPRWLGVDDFYYDHTFINDLNAETENIIIPCQSLANINSSYRLGFHMIEANVKALSDGNYIVCHGGGTGALKFGTQFAHVDGTTDISDVTISSVDLNWVRTNVRYRSSYAKYATYPPTLQEFLYECKKYNMTALVQCVDANVVKIADEILGKYNWVAYGATRDMTDGMIMTVASPDSAIHAVSICRSYGKPYMLCMDNTLSLTADEMKNIINAVHDAGYYIGYIQYYINEQYNQKYQELGFDFCASTWSVNRMDSGNLCNLSGDLTYGDYSTSGTVANGVITLAAGQTVTPAQALGSVFLGKGELCVSFTGKINVQMGKHINNSQESADNPQIRVSTFFLNEAPTFVISANLASTITSITYKASKC